MKLEVKYIKSLTLMSKMMKNSGIMLKIKKLKKMNHGTS